MKLHNNKPKTHFLSLMPWESTYVMFIRTGTDTECLDCLCAPESYIPQFLSPTSTLIHCDRRFGTLCFALLCQSLTFCHSFRTSSETIHAPYLHISSPDTSPSAAFNSGTCSAWSCRFYILRWWWWYDGGNALSNITKLKFPKTQMFFS